MSKSINSIVRKILDFLAEEAEYLPMPFETPYGWIRRTNRLSYKRYYDSVNQLRKSESVKVISKEGKRFIKLTEKGVLKVLFEKAKIPYKKEWDGKWRIILFDIPEDARKQRGILRGLLKWNGFKLLQKSVFISPYELNPDAIEYLDRSGLIKYVRILRVDVIDGEMDLRKQFKLPKD